MKFPALWACLFIAAAASAGPIATTNLLLNPGGEAGTLTNWIVGGTSNPRLDNGTFDSSIKPRSGTNDFLGGTGSLGSLSQTVPLVGNGGLTAPMIDGGALLAYVSFWEQGLSQGTPSDDAYVSLVFLDATSNSLSTWSSPEVDSHLGAWSNYSAYVGLPANTRFIQYTMNFVRNSGNDLDGFVDDNVLAIADRIELPVLKIAGPQTNVLVSWPAFYSDGFVLQQNTNLATTNWILATSPVLSTNGSNQVNFPQPSGSLFFRLHHP